MFGFIFLLVGSIAAGIPSFSFLEGLDTTSPDGWRVVLEIWRIRLTQPAGARLSLAKTVVNSLLSLRLATLMAIIGTGTAPAD